MATENEKVDAPKDAPKDEGKVTAGTLREMIRDEIANVAGKLIPGGGSGETSKDAPKDEGGIRGQVEEAIAALRRREARAQRDKQVDELLAKNAVIEPPKENPPVEVRRVHRFMGWGE